MITVKLYDVTGKLLFAGRVPEEAVKIKYGYGEATTASFNMPIEDMLSSLQKEKPKCSCEVVGAFQSIAVMGDVTTCMICHRVID